MLEPEQYKGIHIQAFADDLLLIGSATTGEELETALNYALEVILKWGGRLKLRFAPHKTQAMLITKKRKYHTPKLTMGGAELAYADEVKVLGLTIDRSLSFRPHLTNTCRKALNFYKAVSRAARAQWGLNAEILRTIYMAVVEPIILYASSCWADTTDKVSTEKLLNRVNRAFAIRTGKAHRTTSLVSSILLAKILPLTLRARENAELYRIKRGKEVEALPGRTLEKRVSPFDLPHPALRSRITFTCLNSQEDIDAIGNSWPHIYTDGSKIEGKVGAAVTCWIDGGERKAVGFRLERYCSVFQAEMAAILRAQELMESTALFKHANIISDSRSALESIGDPNTIHPIAAEIRCRVRRIQEAGGSIAFHWIRAHVGIPGNERADELAKKAALTNKRRAVYDRFPLSYAKHLLRDATLSTWQAMYSGSTSGATTRLFFPNVRLAYKVLNKIKINNRLAQLFTGHGGFRSYLFRFKLMDTPLCTCGDDVEQTIEHLLMECPRFTLRRFECECMMECALTVDNLSQIVSDDDRRSTFLEFATHIQRKTGKENGSRMLD